MSSAFDASDLLSPMLVKELRQGLRTRTFAIPFMVMPGLLAIGSIIRLAAPGDNTDDSTALFWACATLPLLFVASMAFTALRSERKRQTYELLLITLLSPWRILLGKWTCVALQLFLIAATALPFVILRYFLGGVELVTDLMILGDLLGMAALIAAATLAAGVWRPHWPRLMRFGCIGALLLPFSFCLLGAFLAGFAQLLRLNTLFWLNGALGALLILNAAAIGLSPEGAHDGLREDRRVFWFVLLGTLTAQIAAAWPPLMLLALPLLCIATVLLATRSRPPLFALIAILPMRLRGHAHLLTAAAFLALNLAWFFTHPLPATRLLIAATMIGSVVVPWTLGSLLDRSDYATPVASVFLVTIALVVVGLVLNEAFGVAIMPPAALALALLDKAQPGELLPALAIPAVTLLSLWYRAIRRRHLSPDEETPA